VPQSFEEEFRVILKCYRVAFDERYGTFFEGLSSAGSSTIKNNFGGVTQFLDVSTAGNATITTNSSGYVYFYDSATGGQAAFGR
jgi:hypothetical protein